MVRVFLRTEPLKESVLCFFFFCLHSNPSCTDIMEIYNAVEEMDDDDEVSLIDAGYCVLLGELTLASHLYNLALRQRENQCNVKIKK